MDRVRRIVRTDEGTRYRTGHYITYDKRKDLLNRGQEVPKQRLTSPGRIRYNEIEPRDCFLLRRQTNAFRNRVPMPRPQAEKAFRQPRV